MSKKWNKLFTAAMVAGGAALGVLYYQRQRELQELEELNDFDDFEVPAEKATPESEEAPVAEETVNKIENEAPAEKTEKTSAETEIEDIPAIEPEETPAAETSAGTTEAPVEAQNEVPAEAEPSNEVDTTEVESAPHDTENVHFTELE